MYDTDYLYAARNNPIQNEISTIGKRSNLGPDLRAGLPDLRMLNKQLTFLINVIQQVVGGLRIVFENVVPNLDQIQLGSTGSDQRNSATPIGPSRIGDAPPP